MKKTFIVCIPNACYLPENINLEDSRLMLKQGKDELFLILNGNHCGNSEKSKLMIRG